MNKVTKRLANLIYKIPAGTLVDTFYHDGKPIHLNIKCQRDRLFEEKDVVCRDHILTTFRDLFYNLRVKNVDLQNWTN